jgi:hypothetical protein
VVGVLALLVLLASTAALAQDIEVELQVDEDGNVTIGPQDGATESSDPDGEDGGPGADAAADPGADAGTDPGADDGSDGATGDDGEPAEDAPGARDGSTTPTRVDAGSGGFVTARVPVEVLLLMMVGAAGISVPALLASRRR